MDIDRKRNKRAGLARAIKRISVVLFIEVALYEEEEAAESGEGYIDRGSEKQITDL